MQQVSIGKQDFAALRGMQAFYIDKTDFIRQWWESGDDVTLIARPRRFGKTLNMSMLNCFFSNRYADAANLFLGLSIWEHDKYRKLQGTYPVIFISFADVKQSNYHDAVSKIKKNISDVYSLYRELATWEGLTEVEHRQFASVCPQMEDAVAQDALQDLSKYLCRYYGKKAVILLDEYDTPLQEAYIGGYWNELTTFIRSLFNSTFKTNAYLERAIMTGITRVSKESIFSDLNNLKVVTTTSNEYADCFGFTEAEVQHALAQFGLADRMPDVKRWYDGFTFGACRDIYNPWSITNYLDEGQIKPYWAMTSSNGLVNRMLRTASPTVKQLMEQLLNRQEIEVTFDEQIVYDQLDERQDAIWGLMLAGGYLKVQALEYKGELMEPWYHLLITNLETYSMFVNMFRGWFQGSKTNYNAFVDAMLVGDLKAMNRYMNDIAIETFSSFDVGHGSTDYTHPERFYHGFVLGLLAQLRDRYTIRSNRESGYGRYDVMLIPKQAQDDAIILEFKVQDTAEETDLSDTVKTALHQIAQKHYDAELIAQGIPQERIRCYGFAFAGKRILIGGSCIH